MTSLQSHAKHSNPSYQQFDQFRSFSSSPTPAPTPSGKEFVVLYRGKGIRLFRVLVRLKIFQLTGVAALAIPITTFLNNGDVSTAQAVIAGGLLFGSGAASTALWYYSRRYVGEMALSQSPHKNTVRFSVLDFWGNRENKDVDVRDVVPPLQGLAPVAATAVAAQPFLPLAVVGDRQYILSLKYGRVVHGDLLRNVLDGTLAVKDEKK